jgi:hypothetical protein
MMSDSFITVRLMVESMQLQIAKVLDTMNFEEQINSAVKKAVEAFDFEKEVERQVQSILGADIQHAVRSKLQYISRDVTDKLVREMLSDALRKLT